MKPAEGGVAIEKIGLTVGDQLTVQGYRGEHNGSPQMAQYGYYVSHKDACESPVIQCSDNSVTITCPTTGAKIYYTTDTEYSEYTAPFEISEDETVKAYATADGMLQSIVVTEECIWEDPNAGEKYYVKVTSAPTDWSGTYLLVGVQGSKYYALNQQAFGSWGTTSQVTAANNKIECDDITSAYAIVITSGTASGTYSLRLLDNSYISGSAAKKFNKEASTSAAKTDMKLTYNANGTVSIECAEKAGRKVHYNYNNGQGGFRFYDNNTSLSQPYLYKLEN